ncbi:putative leucine-rich repeat-containing protein DDB_G0290503 [Drosophila obscura]|uniref:putative leucine-rich repeat-containing protein DDB_G0290503 n=1 Tax=Drosophila obscura TaxID=7282 RepID=UPI001BB2AEB9|nr:putative leucine-rich repeat-containing protein DDB_G0290503 [Drosophila obscura]
MEVYKYKIEVQMSDTSGQPGKSPAPEVKPEGREFLDEGSKEDLLADTQVIRRSLESRLDKLREEKKWAEQCNTQLKIDLDKIKKRYNALESDFEAMVLEKELKIHELKDSLKLAQIRCHQLEPENVHQQQYITQLEARQATLEHTNAQLNRHMKEIVAEISSLKNNKSRVGLICQDDFVTLQKKLEERNKELLLLIEHEHETLNTVATLYEEKTRLQLRLVQMEQKWGAVKQYLAKSYLQLQQNIHPFISKRDALRLELDRHKGLLVAAQTEVNRLTQLQQRRRQAKLEPENCRCGQGEALRCRATT